MDEDLEAFLRKKFISEYSRSSEEIFPVIKNLHSNFFFKIKDIAFLDMKDWKSMNLPLNIFILIKKRIEEINFNQSNNSNNKVNQLDRTFLNNGSQNFPNINLNIINNQSTPSFPPINITKIVLSDSISSLSDDIENNPNKKINDSVISTDNKSNIIISKIQILEKVKLNLKILLRKYLKNKL